MPKFVSLNTAPLAKNGKQVWSADAHNRRLAGGVYKTASPSRTHLNQSLVATEDLRASIWERIDSSGVSLPKNAENVAQELVLSASPEYFRPSYHRDDPEGWGKYDKAKMEEWRDRTMEWMTQKFGKENIVSAELHLDEKTPHIHAVIVPITEVEIKKRRTNAEIKRDNAILAENPKAEINRETYKKTKWNRSAWFDKKGHEQLQEEYGNALNDIGLNRGIPKKLTRRLHKSVTESLKEQWLYFNYPKKKPEMPLWETPEPRTKKKFFESTQDFVDQIMVSVNKTSKRNQKESEKRIREADRQRSIAQKNSEKLQRENLELRNAMPALSGFKHEDILAALDFMQEQRNRIEQAKNKKKDRDRTTPSPDLTP